MGSKPGWRTSEFWLSAAVALAGVMLPQLATDLPPPWGPIAGLLAAALAAHGYATSRGMVKQAGSATSSADVTVSVPKA